MGKHLKKALLCCAGLLLALVLSGCSLESSVENLFTLPKVPIEYTELAKRIEALLSNGYEYTSRQRQQHPVGADGRSERRR